MLTYPLIGLSAQQHLRAFLAIQIALPLTLVRITSAPDCPKIGPN